MVAVAKLTIDQALQLGIEAHKAGQVQEADRLYTAILSAQPNHPDANYNMGVLAVGVGKVELALPFFETAIEATPTKAQFWLSYIDALIKLGRFADANAVLFQAKSNDVKGGGFDQLEIRLNEADKEPLEASKTASDPPPKQPNILDSLKMDQAIRLAKKKAKEGAPENAKRIYQDILTKFPKNKRASDGLKGLTGGTADKFSQMGDLSKYQLETLINLHSEGQFQQALKQATTLLQRFPNSSLLLNICGIIYKGLGKLDESIEAFTKALAIKPDFAEAYNNKGNTLIKQDKLDESIEAFTKALEIKPEFAEAYNNMGNALQKQGKLHKSIEAFTKALAIKPGYAEAFYNMGNALQEQGKLEKAIKAYNEVLAIKPNYADAYNNMGNALKDQGKLEEAIEAHNKALAIKPNNAKAYNNIGNALKDQSKLEEAVEAYNKTLAIKPENAKAHRHLSSITNYNSDTTQISEVEALLQGIGLDNSDRCHLLYTYAKMQEDLGYLSTAFNSYVAGGNLRQKLLAYEFKHDENMFSKIRKTVPQFKDVALNLTSEPIRHTPIFILGMPRSGTTLVEQIVSSHTEVTGAGELNYAEQFGIDLTIGQKPVNAKTVQQFRERYHVELAKRADGKAFVTDKMPQNFRLIALICSAFPEAKIVHVQRNAQATCWSNFKQYFAAESLGYSCNLGDTIKYYGLYKDLMHFLSQSYSDRIYSLNYDKLTEHQERETRRLVEHLGLNWEDACLVPQKNKRSVRTASQKQVRQKVYKGSSQAWRKYEPFLNGLFDGL